MMSGLKQRSSNGAAADSLLEARMHASMRAVDSMCGAEKALTPLSEWSASCFSTTSAHGGRESA